jgi:SAM-dependent methyltransferase
MEKKKISDTVRDYYARFGDREWTRLENPDDGAVEFAVTKYILDKYLPPKARILDIGGGPGRYAIWLAKRGHRVVLADLSPELLEIAHNKISQEGVGSKIEDVNVADARDLSPWENESFDAALCLGPFYHLPDSAEREQAAAELSRVLRPGGLAFVALMPRYAFLRRTLAIPDERCHLAQPDFVERLLQDGVFYNDIPGRFTCGWGANPNEVAPFFEKFGLSALTLLATEGIIVDIQRCLIELAESDPLTYQAAFEVVVNIADDPSILGMATHLLYVGKK